MTAHELAQQLADLLAAHLEITGRIDADTGEHLPEPDPDEALTITVEDAEAEGPLFARFRVRTPWEMYAVTVEEVPGVKRG